MSRAYPGIDRRQRHGRAVWRARVRRAGQSLAAEFPTPEAALAWRAQVLEALSGRGEVPVLPSTSSPRVSVDRRDSRPTVEDACRSLACAMRDGTARTKQGRAYRPSVVRSYEENLRTLVVPALGGYPLAALTCGDVQRVVDAIAAERTPEHARKALVAMRVVVRLAIRDGQLKPGDDPCRGVRQPQGGPSRRGVRILTPGEAESLLGAATTDDRRLGRSLAEPLVSVLIGCGIRTGEALALTWGDGVDLDVGRLRIVQTLDRDRNESGRLAIVEGAKSAAGIREIPLPLSTETSLRRHYLASGRPPSGTLVFVDSEGAPISAKGMLAHLWRRIVRAADIASPQPTLHHLRHTWAVWSLRSGSPPEVVRALGGWSSTAMVHARYGPHVFPEELSESAIQLERWRTGKASGRS